VIYLRDLRWLADTVRDVHAAQTVDELCRLAGDAMDRRFFLFGSACEEVGPEGSLYIPHRIRTGAPPPPDHAVYFHDNPFGALISDGQDHRVMHMHQAVPAKVWHRTDHYNGIARAMDWNDQLMIVAQNRGTLVAFGMYRKGVFSDYERALALLLQPHLEAAWTRIRRIQPTAPCLPGPLRIELAADQQPLVLSGNQRQTLCAYFPGWRASRTLPDKLSRWIADSLRALTAMPPVRPLRVLVIEGARGRLLARCFPQRDRAGVTLVMVEELRGHAAALPPLSPRESEVLAWIAQGKRDTEIGRILGIAAATVSKHVEHLLRKTGARSRTEAVALLRAQVGSV
jgi:DNA-binding CsgD family transcriptional regulator